MIGPNSIRAALQIDGDGQTIGSGLGWVVDGDDMGVMEVLLVSEGDHEVEPSYWSTET